MKPEHSLINISFSPRITYKRKNWKKRLLDNLRFFSDRFFKDCQPLISTFSVALVATTIFLGGSYLFFIQLAEYGW